MNRLGHNPSIISIIACLIDTERDKTCIVCLSNNGNKWLRLFLIGSEKFEKPSHWFLYTHGRACAVIPIRFLVQLDIYIYIYPGQENSCNLHNIQMICVLEYQHKLRFCYLHLSALIFVPAVNVFRMLSSVDKRCPVTI